MGYQVGLSCFENKEQAENVYFSQTVPIISQDGQLIQMQHSPTGWVLNGQIVQASLPECNPMDNFQDGSLIGWGLVSIMAAIWAIRIIWEKLL